MEAKRCRAVEHISNLAGGDLLLVSRLALAQVTTYTASWIPPSRPESCSSGGAGNGNSSGDRGAAGSGGSTERRSAEREAGEQPSSGGGGYQGGQPRDPPPPPPQDKPWNYSSIDLINSGAQAFWQNYSGTRSFQSLIAWHR
ncbi:unnamed protein product [Nezara viridula]|uniref:Uncharacterized protein n=1 Tax=Nezara viridula TaxID=85310 RepID=A0A9P0HJR3_NEZVI|nr:unnamed protein product [Nezara viridula]